MPRPDYTYKAQCLSVVDGDTAKVLCDLGFDTSIKITLRLYGINTPEIHSKIADEREQAQKAKARLIELIEGKEIIVRTFKTKEKYGRYLAQIFLVDSVCVNDVLVDEGLAEAYYGEKR